MNFRRPILITAFAATALLVAAGCGGSSGGGGGSGGGSSGDRTITVNWGTEPPSLDPGLATDTTSANILENIMDPLVRLDDKLNPTPGLAESWNVTNGGKTVTFHLRSDGRWTNGDPVTAQDFEYSWKRTLSPKLGADYAYQFFGIVGAQDYNACKKNCAALRDKVGVQALDDRTLQVQLTSSQPWFLKQVAHHSFLAVSKKAVEQYGNKWTEAGNIVTDGPFKLARWAHDSRIDLVKWDAWRNADQVSLQRVNGRMISDGTTAVQAFDAGEIDVNNTIPPEELPRYKGTDVYEQYPALGTYYYGLNVKNIPDVRQRRAMAMAIDRRTIIDNVAQADQLPATGFTPKGNAGLRHDQPGLEVAARDGELRRSAKQLMAQVASPVRSITLYYNESPGHKAIATAVQSEWKKLGLNVTIKSQEFAQFLQFLGPPPNKSVDAYRLGWIGDYADAMNFLDLWTCGSGNNNSNYCDPKYDALVKQARATQDDAKRFAIYGQLEDMLFGPNGAVPVVPIYWYTYTYLEKPSIKATFNVNLLDQIDLTKVRIES